MVSGFNSTFRSLILDIITSAELAICWNGEMQESFRPTRCLRRGDPLSSYLFVLCMETLSHRITKLVDQKCWRPIRLSRAGMHVSHLFFADDLLLFGEASYSQARLMEHVLRDFYQEFGQRVNKDKSIVWFAPKTPGYLTASICSSFGIKAAASLGTYLGVKLCHDRKQKPQFQSIVEKARRRLASWKARLLSKVARLLLIRTTLASLPVYNKQSSHFPVSIVRELEGISRRFLWGAVAGERKFHPIRWEIVCTPKDEGWLGIPPLRITNEALLVKLAWRILHDSHSLCSGRCVASMGVGNLWLMDRKYIILLLCGVTSTLSNRYCTKASVGRQSREMIYYSGMIVGFGIHRCWRRP